MTANRFPKARLCAEIALALIIYSIITFIFLEPALCSGGTVAIGDGESDVWKHLWGAWWMHNELSQGRFPVWTDLQNFPAGGRLYVIDPLNAICTALTLPCVGLVNAYNLTQAAQLILASLSAWGLTRWITKDHRAALVAGFIYGFCPFILSSGIASGIDETSNLAWLPLSIWGLLLCLNGEQPRWGVLLGGLGLALAAIGSWYYGITAGIFWLIMCVWSACTGRAPAGDNPKANWLYPLTAAILSALIALPLAILFAQSLKGESSLLGRVNITERQETYHLEFMYRTFDFKNNAVLSGYFQPGKSQISVATDVDKRLKTVYIGWIALILAGIACKKARHQARFWLVSALILGTLSLGPYLAITSTIALSKPWNPLYLFAYYVVPGFRMVAICDRLSIGVQLCVAVLAALSLRCILPQGNRGLAVSAILGLGVIAEVMFVSPVPWPLPQCNTQAPLFCQKLAEQPEHLGLICLPLNRANHTLQPGEYYYWQTIHGKPLPATLTTRFSDSMMNNRLVGALYLCEDDDYTTPPPSSVFAGAVHELQNQGFGWIAVNEGIFTDAATKRMCTILTPLLGNPQKLGNTYLYDLRPQPTHASRGK